MTVKSFRLSDVGCYADGAHGHKHIRTVLANLCSDIGRTDLAVLLHIPMSDDAAEEHEALEALNTVTSDDVYWELVDGDLMLRPVGDHE